MTGPAISVLMPVRDAVGTVAAAMRSVLVQTEADFEFLVIDDGSVDGSAEVLGAFAASDPRIRPWRFERSGGIVAALNHGLAVARAPLIARMDADDLALPERLGRQRRHLEAMPGIGLVGTCVSYGGDRAVHAGYAAYVDWTNGLLTHAQIALNRFVESPFAHPSVMFRRDLIDRHGTYRAGAFPEDYELWLRWLDAGVHMAKLPECLLVWNDPPGRLSRTDARYSFRAFHACKAIYLTRWLARHNPHHPHIIVWGAGRETRKRAEHVAGEGAIIDAYVDIDPRKIGKVIAGRPVLAPERLPAPNSCFVVSYVSSRGAREDIRKRLRNLGFTEGVNALMAA